MNLSRICPGPIPRRRFLQAGSLLWGGLGLSDLLRLRAASADQELGGRHTSVILVWLEGGPSQFETYDPKPEAPLEYRGEFSAIDSCVPGLILSEHLPKHAQIADKFTIIRSIAHDIADHPGAAALVLSGRKPRNISDPVSKFPDFPSIVHRMRRDHRSGVPAYVSNDRRTVRRGRQSECARLPGRSPQRGSLMAGPFAGTSRIEAGL